MSLYDDDIAKIRKIANEEIGQALNSFKGEIAAVKAEIEKVKEGFEVRIDLAIADSEAKTKKLVDGLSSVKPAKQGGK